MSVSTNASLSILQGNPIQPSLFNVIYKVKVAQVSGKYQNRLESRENNAVLSQTESIHKTNQLMNSFTFELPMKITFYESRAGPEL